MKTEVKRTITKKIRIDFVLNDKQHYFFNLEENEARHLIQQIDNAIL